MEFAAIGCFDMMNSTFRRSEGSYFMISSNADK